MPWKLGTSPLPPRDGFLTSYSLVPRFPGWACLLPSLCPPLIPPGHLQASRIVENILGKEGAAGSQVVPALMGRETIGR